MSKRLSVLVTHRDREQHLEQFLDAVPKYLDNTNIDYNITIIEQNNSDLFNKGVLYNAGFLFNQDSDYFVLHDVDLIPEKVDYSYSSKSCCLLSHCKNHPIFTKKNNTSSVGHYGGVVLVPKAAYLAANGHSNLYRGWGCEDDDFSARLSKIGHSRNYRPNCWFYNLEHKLAKEPISHQRNAKILMSKKDFKLEGLNTVSFEVDRIKSISEKINHIWISFGLFETPKDIIKTDKINQTSQKQVRSYGGNPRPLTKNINDFNKKVSDLYKERKDGK